jgi:hypothetical protein
VGKEKPQEEEEEPEQDENYARQISAEFFLEPEGKERPTRPKTGPSDENSQNPEREPEGEAGDP